MVRWETYKVFGYDPCGLNPRWSRHAGEFVLPIEISVQPTIDRASEAKADLDFEHRLLMPDGSVNTVTCLLARRKLPRAISDM